MLPAAFVCIRLMDVGQWFCSWCCQDEDLEQQMESLVVRSHAMYSGYSQRASCDPCQNFLPCLRMKGKGALRCRPGARARMRNFERVDGNAYVLGSNGAPALCALAATAVQHACPCGCCGKEPAIK